MKTHTSISNIDPAVVRIRSFIKDNSLSNVAFAKMVGLRESTIRRIFYDDPNPTLNILRKMESVIPKNYTPNELSAPQ